MAGTFFDSFNATLPDLESSFTEDWIINGNIYPAIAINDMDDKTRMMKGGSFNDVTVTILVRDAILAQSGAIEGSIVIARGKEMCILVITSQGDACKELSCGPAQIDVWET